MAHRKHTPSKSQFQAPTTGQNGPLRNAISPKTPPVDRPITHPAAACAAWGKHFCPRRGGRWTETPCAARPSKESPPQANRGPLGKNTKFWTAPTDTASTDKPASTSEPAATGRLLREQTPLPGEAGYSSYQEQRYEWLWHLRRLSSLKRVRECGLFVDTLRGHEFATVRKNGHGKARWLNVCQCGSRWPCPVCAPWKAEQERRRLMVALCKAMLATNSDDFDPAAPDFEALARERRYEVLFLTATAPHKWGAPLRPTTQVILDAWNYACGTGRRRGLGGGRETWQKVWGVEGFARCLDLTHGPNGWHPHIHAAIIVDADKVRQAGGRAVFLAWFRAWFFARWNYRVKTLLDLPDHAVGCSIKHGVVVEFATDAAAVAKYVQKEALGPAMELTEGHRKRARPARARDDDGDVDRRLASQGHRSPFQILADLCELDTERLSYYWPEKETDPRTPDNAWQPEEYDADTYDPHDFRHDLALWHEYEEAMKGRSALRTSKGFWRHPVFGVEGMTTADMVEFLADSVDPREALSVDDPEDVLECRPWLYSALVREGLDGWVLRVCEEGGEAFTIVRDYVDHMRPETRPPPYFKRRSLDWLVKLAEAARGRAIFAAKQAAANNRG